MEINLTSHKNGKLIHNRTDAAVSYGKDRDYLRIAAIDEKYTPMQVDGFSAWCHAVTITGKATYFCESI